MRSTFSLLLCGCLAVATASATPQNLPSMGEPADSTMSLGDEQRLGDEFMRQIRASVPLVQDEEIEEALQSLGMRLARASGKAEERAFTFFVVDDPDINAFAIPGGYIGVNAGLILAMNREEQLAGVLAHEVAHLTQRHHARAFATSTRNSVSAAAALLAAILIGQASPEAGQATLAAGIAATQQSAINFTRANEIEADRIGIDILAAAGLDAGAMAESFRILRRENRLNAFGDELEYLRTHPLDNNRIAEATDRAAGRPAVAHVAQEDFTLLQARLAVLTADDGNALEREYRQRFERSGSTGSAYALALMYLETNRIDEMAEPMAVLRKQAAGHLIAELLDARYLHRIGERDASRRKLHSLTQVFEHRYAPVAALIAQLVDARRLSRAREVAERYLRDSANPDPQAWHAIAGIEQSLGNLADSHEALSRHFEALREPDQAARQVELALRHVAAGSLDEIRLRARLKSLRRDG